MRYVFILIMSMSFSAHAEWREFENFYMKDIEFTANQRVSVQVLVDADGFSFIWHMQYQCDNGVPTKERNFWHAYYEGRMGTGNVTYGSEGAPWVPFRDNRFTQLATQLCQVANTRFD